MMAIYGVDPDHMGTGRRLGPSDALASGGARTGGARTSRVARATGLVAGQPVVWTGGSAAAITGADANDLRRNPGADDAGAYSAQQHLQRRKRTNRALPRMGFGFRAREAGSDGLRSQPDGAVGSSR